MADIKSESRPASNRNWWPASYWNAWPASSESAVKAAAEALKFSAIELHTDADKALAAGAHEGVLKGSGRMIVGSVSAEVYQRIEEHVRKGAGGPDASQPEIAAAATTEGRRADPPRTDSKAIDDAR